MSWRGALVCLLACSCSIGQARAAQPQTINVLWYTYSHPESNYRRMLARLANVVHTIPAAGGIRWRVFFFEPDMPRPGFDKFHVLVIHSGEGFGSQRPSAPPPTRVDFSGILKFKAEIEAARGTRTVLTGSDPDVHAIGGATGNVPSKDGYRFVCEPVFVGRNCWDGAVGHLVNAVNWAANGKGLGIVSFVAAEFPGSQWWLHRDSFLRAELSANGTRTDLVTIFGPGTRENHPVIPATAQDHPLNAGLSSKGMGNWNHSFHAGFAHALQGYVPYVNSTRYPQMAVAIYAERAGNARK